MEEYKTPRVVEAYLKSKLVEGYSELTVKYRKYFLDNFFKYVDKAPEEVKVNDIRLFLFDYKEERKIEFASLEEVRQAIHCFYTWMVEEEFMSENPCAKIKKIKAETKERAFLTPGELDEMRGACKYERDSVILEFLYSTGCRISEVCNMKIADVNFENRTVKIFGKGRKERTGYLTEKAAMMLREYLEHREDDCDALFVSLRRPYKAITPRSIQMRMKDISEHTSITKKVSPHVIRHTTATIALRNGMPIEDIQKMLGHSSINTTLIYAKVDNEQVQYKHDMYVV